MDRIEQFTAIQEAIRVRLEKKHVASALALSSVVWTAQDKLGFVEISQRELAYSSGLCVATINTLLGRLERVGLLTVTRSRYRTVHRYVVHPPLVSPTTRSAPAATKRPSASERPPVEPPAARAAAILAEIKVLQGQTFEEKGGLLRILPAARAQIATLRAELSALEIPSPQTTPTKK